MRTRSRLLALLAVALLPAPAPGQSADVRGTVRLGGRPAAEVVVSLEPEGGSEPERSPDPVVGAEASPVIDQRSLRFRPGVVAVRPGTRVEFLNSDPILHNVFSPGVVGEGFDLGTYPSGHARDHVFRAPGPHVILCHVHPEMAAYVVVVPTPHHAVTGPDGRFALEGVPPGRYRLRAWMRGIGVREERLRLRAGDRRELVLDLDAGGSLVVRGRP